MINITTSELYNVLDMTPASQNIMLAGRHGIGKSEILSEYYGQRGMKVVALFLGQMSDPGDLIGLPHKNEQTGKTEFMPPYWFPVDDKPIVLFLDELNRARPEILQTVMDLCLNRTLAGRKLPEGSRLISAVNVGEEYQLTDLDPALVSRFNVYAFRPTSEEWLLWAEKNKVDKRIRDFIQNDSLWLDGNAGENVGLDTGLEKTPDRRAWKKVSDIITNHKEISLVDRKVIAGIVGVKATAAFIKTLGEKKILNGEDILMHWTESKKLLKNYKLHEISQVNDSVFRYLDSNEFTGKDKTAVKRTLPKYIEYLMSECKEGMAHFVSIFNQNSYQVANTFITLETPDVWNTCIGYISSL